MLNISVPKEAARVAPPELVLPFPRQARSTQSRVISPGTTIYFEGFRRSPAYRLVDGCVAISQTLRDGRRQIVDILGPGRLFGLSLGDSNACSAESLTYTHIEQLDDSLAPSETQQEVHLMLRRAQAHATLLGRKTAMEKVASAVLDLSCQFARPSRSSKRRRVTFTLYLTRADLADWLGLTVETVSRCLNQLKRGALIDFTHPEIVTILDRDALLEIADINGTCRSM
ncbi:MAG: helix-turn-helix domain-containing protein [Rhizobiaceae bacterium]|nr:helix-turn-helix domain-containing protein [Rhizobiaceae bacterium]